MFGFLFKKIFGSTNDRYLHKLRPMVQRINAFEPEMQQLADADFPVRIAQYRQEVQDGTRTLDALLPEVFALVREASSRRLGMRHYDVQLIGGMVLHKGKIAEMKTGEGKTLVATLPVVLNALSGKGVHVVTVNDYLAKRDSAWMGQLYEFLGLSTGVIVHGLDDEERKAEYAKDITYGTNNEFGFDYLRDNMKFYANQLVQRGHNFAIVDEVDSILIDEARTPLIISGASDESVGMYRTVDDIVRQLTAEHYTVDEKARTAMLTDEGVARCEELLKLDNLFDPANITAQHHVMQSLKAHQIFKRDVDYIVQEDQVIIVDEFTGRLMAGRRYSDGLHQALEAKEHVTIAAENQTLASITFQNYFRLYDKLSGMTGTADTEAVEFHQIYSLEVISIPPNVLNAKQHEKEAEIVALAGQKGRVTIATNMAGRGTDIMLGEGVVDLGGLHILGTERHESRRIDNQLRGRSGRQGDPGSSRFYLSLEDDLMRLFGSDRIKGLMEKLGLRDGEAIENAMVTRAVEGAQKRVEAHHFEIRKTLLDYDNVMNQQREVIYTLRRELMVEENLEPVLQEFMSDVLDDVYSPLASLPVDGQDEARAAALARLREVFNLDRVLEEGARLPEREETEVMAQGILDKLRAETGPTYADILRYFLLEELDRCWKEHLRNMDALRDGIGLRGYGQRDPKLEYKREGFEMFQAMLFQIRESVFRALTRIRVQIEPIPAEPEQQEVEAPVQEMQHSPVSREYRHKESNSQLSYSSGGSISEDPKKPAKAAPRIGRNDLCPCGSGKKYKKCCGQDK